MTYVLTIFKARLRQDSALSVSGIDAPSTSEQPFTRVDGIPLLSGRGLRGAAVAMARRCFASLPASVTGPPLSGEASSAGDGPPGGAPSSNKRPPTTRSAWEIDHARPTSPQEVHGALRAGVGILQATGARADGVLYDREVMPAGTTWELMMRVDWRRARAAGDDPREVEGILGYVLAAQWAEGRCWLGGGAARGLGWCHLEREHLEVYRLDEAAHQRWLDGGALPAPEREVPRRAPTRSWCFRFRDVTLQAGERRETPKAPAWGLDMLTIGAHEQEASWQFLGTGRWVTPRQPARSEEVAALAAAQNDADPGELSTNRALVMEGGAPLLPGSSLRGPLRHAFSRRCARRGERIEDPNLHLREVPMDDVAGQLFGTVAQSSRVLIRDARAEPGWVAARLQLHAEDELSAGSFDSAKRDEVRLLQARFTSRILVEGASEGEIAPALRQLDELLALGQLGHLPIGGRKMQGAGWGSWRADGGWQRADVEKLEEPPARRPPPPSNEAPSLKLPSTAAALAAKPRCAVLRLTPLSLDDDPRAAAPAGLGLGEAAALARRHIGAELVCWWCEPRIVLGLAAPATFGWSWPLESPTLVDEVVFFGERSSWRAARTATGWRAVQLEAEEPPQGEAPKGTYAAIGKEIPARLHQQQSRFDAELSAQGALTLIEWSCDGQVFGYTAKRRGARHGQE